MKNSIVRLRASWMPTSIAAVLAFAGCATSEPAPDLEDQEGLLPPAPGTEDLDYHDDGIETATLAPLAAGTTVGGAVSSACSTSAVLGLSLQIADEMVCLKPTGFTKFAETSSIHFSGSAVLPYLAPSALTALKGASSQQSLTINSGFRTIAQQYLLYKWSLAKSCGISVAAKPGTSNHETGRAVDVHNFSAALSAMKAHGWSHSVPGDPVHFDYLHATDLRGLDLTAFQKLYNLNHASAPIAVTGKWDTATASALARSPAAGFATGPSCGAPQTTSWDQVIRADLDGNGDDELGFYDASSGTFAWYPMTTDGQLGTRLSSTAIGTNWTTVLGIDPDGDGADSLAFYDAKTGAFAVYTASVAGLLGTRKSSTTLGTGWTSIVAADFDGDGRDELAFYNATNGAFAVYATNADGSPGAQRTALTLGTGWSQVLAFDVTDDGVPELAFYNATTGGYAVYATTTAGGLDTRLSAGTLSKGWTSIQPVQAVGSGRTQLSFYNRTTNGFAIYAVDATGQLGTELSSFPLN